MKITNLELDTRSKLLVAAVKVFGKSGFEAASVRQIADLAGVNHGAIKYHYSSKSDLWRAAVHYLFTKLERTIHATESMWEGMTPRERIVDNTRSYIRFNAEHPELHRMVIFESMSGGERLDWLNENYIRPFTDRSINAVALAQEQGVYPADVPPLNLHCINVAAARAMFLMAPEIEHSFGIDVFCDEEVERHVQAVVTMLLEPRGADAGPSRGEAARLPSQ